MEKIRKLYLKQINKKGRAGSRDIIENLKQEAYCSNDRSKSN